MQGAARKPVLFTELGWPATGHSDPNNPDSIYEDHTTRQKTADLMKDMVKFALGESLSSGMFYFEYSDEWRKQDVSERASHGNKYSWNGTPAGPTAFPNGYWDEEGFGLYSLKKGAGLANDADPWNGFHGPVLLEDDQIERTEMTSILKAVYNNSTR